MFWCDRLAQVGNHRLTYCIAMYQFLSALPSIVAYTTYISVIYLLYLHSNSNSTIREIWLLYKYQYTILNKILSCMNNCHSVILVDTSATQYQALQCPGCLQKWHVSSRERPAPLGCFALLPNVVMMNECCDQNYECKEEVENNRDRGRMQSTRYPLYYRYAYYTSV